MLKFKLLSTLLFCATLVSRAAVGDTSYLKVFDKYHMGSYGNHDKKGFVPATTPKSQRIWMKYTIGCTANGQCEWDYTIKLNLREHTGKKDSTLKQAPSFKVINGTAKDTIVYFSTDTTYTETFNTTTKVADTVPTTKILIAMFGDVQNPLVCTDTLIVWPGRYYHYAFDTTGKRIDSVMSIAPDTMQVTYTPYYAVFEIINDLEMGRMISPYAKNFPKTFQYEYWYDVTDFEAYLHDTIDIRIKYEGYSWGFTSTVEFYFVEGTPNRTSMGMQTLYNAYYNYGQATSIENALNTKKFTVPADAAGVKLRLLITGHGGESSENCAEFCPKYYYLKLNNKQIGSQLVWKDDCGSNAIINQPGTWIYDRSNWCPGEKIRLIEYPLDVAPGSIDSIDLDMEPFSASGAAGYNISAYVVYYKNIVRTVDAGIEDIIAPSKNFWYSRVNPVCDNARIILKNWGSQSLTSAEITYQVGDALPVKFNWTGSLGFEAQTEVRLPYMNWSPDLSKNTFKVWVSKVNNADISLDENSYNNTMTSEINIPASLPSSFIIETQTNTKPQENSYIIKDAYNNVVFTKSFTKASTLHRDTFNLGLGCYTFEHTDEGKDGLSFWANNDGSGYVRFRTASSPITILKTFNADFGNFLQFHFTTMYKVGLDDRSLADLQNTKVYPSPASDVILIESNGSIVTGAVYDLSNRLVFQTETNWNNTISVNHIPNGIYLIKLTDSSGNSVFKKIVISH